MAQRKTRKARTKASGAASTSNVATGVSSPVEQLLLAALERGGDSYETGRFLATFKEGAATEATAALSGRGMRVADARDFDDQEVRFAEVDGADAVMFPEVGVALLSGDASQAEGIR